MSELREDASPYYRLFVPPDGPSNGAYLEPIARVGATSPDKRDPQQKKYDRNTELASSL